MYVYAVASSVSRLLTSSSSLLNKTAIGAASVIGSTAIGASAHYWMSNKQRYSFQQELSDVMTEYQKKYKKSTEPDTLN